jgi:hypothetical protein
MNNFDDAGLPFDGNVAFDFAGVALRHHQAAVYVAGGLLGEPWLVGGLGCQVYVERTPVGQPWLVGGERGDVFLAGGALGEAAL